MKKQLLGTILLMNAFLLFTGSLFAQDRFIQANVPFPFMVKDQMFPAGTYTIRKSDEDNGVAYTIRSLNGRISEVFLTEEAQKLIPPSKTELVFNEVGQKHFLYQFFDAGAEIGRQVTKSQAELKLQG